MYTAFTYITTISIWSMHPEVLVDTRWVEDHLKDSNVRIAEVDYDPKANYQLGHVPGAILLDWKEDMSVTEIFYQENRVRDYYN
jgi:3-mercaptopyruvate sulfurtransferase SseA